MAFFLPLFPLNLVAFPGEELKLHVFEPRYRQLINECISMNKTFGIPVFFNEQVQNYGTEMRVSAIQKRHPNGEMDIVTRGLKIIKIQRFESKAPHKLYPGGIVEYTENIQDEDIVLQANITSELHQLYDALRIQKDIGKYKSYDLAHHMGLSIEQEYQLLQITRESDRQAFVLKHLRKIIPIIIETERLKHRIKMNGHFKNFKELDF